jgi:hypothetical protein
MARTTPANPDMLGQSSMEAVIHEGTANDWSEEPIIDLGDGDAEHPARRPSPGIESPISTPSQHSRSSSHADFARSLPPSPIRTRHKFRPRADSAPPSNADPNHSPFTFLTQLKLYSTPSLSTTQLPCLRRLSPPVHSGSSPYRYPTPYPSTILLPHRVAPIPAHQHADQAGPFHTHILPPTSGRNHARQTS